MKKKVINGNNKLKQKRSLKVPVFFISLVAIFIILGVLIRLEPWLWFVESIYIDTPTPGIVSWQGNVQNSENINLVIRFKNGSVWRPDNNSVTWKSSDKNIISVQNKHTLSVNKTGKVILNARLYLFTTKKELSIAKTEQNIKIITPDVVKLLPYSSVNLQNSIIVEYIFSDGSTNRGSPDVKGWYSTDKNIATVSDDGIIMGWSAGKCQLYSNNHEQKLAVAIEVMPATSSNFTISNINNKNFSVRNNVIYVNSNLFSISQPLNLELLANCEGNLLPISEGKLLRWSTQTLDKIVVLPNGKLLPIGEGSASVDVYIGDVLKNITIEITNNKAISLTPEVSNIVVNKQGTISDILLKAKFLDGSTYDVTNLVTWSSSNSFVAEYDKKFDAIVANYPGEAILTASYNSLSADITLGYKEGSQNGN